MRCDKHLMGTLGRKDILRDVGLDLVNMLRNLGANSKALSGAYSRTNHFHYIALLTLLFSYRCFSMFLSILHIFLLSSRMADPISLASRLLILVTFAF